MENVGCKQVLKNGRNCKMPAKKEGYCTRHYNIHAKLIQLQSKKQKVEAVAEANIKVDNPEIICPICLDPVSHTDDALLTCSYYMNTNEHGKNKCGIHAACAKDLRDPKCPLCKTAIETSTARLNIEPIKKNRQIDVKTWNDEASNAVLPPEILQELRQELFEQLFNNNNEPPELVPDDEDAIIAEIIGVINDFGYVEDNNELHHAIHVAIPNLTCAEITNFTQHAFSIL